MPEDANSLESWSKSAPHNGLCREIRPELRTGKEEDVKMLRCYLFRLPAMSAARHKNYNTQGNRRVKGTGKVKVNGKIILCMAIYCRVLVDW